MKGRVFMSFDGISLKNVLFELNFTIFVCISYLTLINYVPYFFEMNKYI